MGLRSVRIRPSDVPVRAVILHFRRTALWREDQARIFFRDGKVFIENLDSGNTVELDDRSVKDTAELKNGSRLTLGSTELRVQYE